MESAKASESYTRSEIRRILGINENRLRSWERLGLTEVRDRYSFADLISLKTLQSLRENRIPATRIQEALHRLRLRLSNVRRPLDELKIVSDGRRIAVEMPGEKMEALTGQMIFNFDAGALRSVATLESQQSSSARSRRADGGESLFQYALELERHGTPANDIVDVYRQVLECNPGAAGAWINIGTQHYRQGRLSLAEHSYQQALQVFPEYALAYFNLGNVCEDTDRLEEAAEHYRQALRYRTDYADAHYNLALVQEQRKHFLEAAKHWQAYLNLDSSSPWSNIARRKRECLLRLAPAGDPPAGASFRKPLQEAKE